MIQLSILREQYDHINIRSEENGASIIKEFFVHRWGTLTFVITRELNGKSTQAHLTVDGVTLINAKVVLVKNRGTKQSTKRYETNH